MARNPTAAHSTARPAVTRPIAFKIVLMRRHPFAEDREQAVVLRCVVFPEQPQNFRVGSMRVPTHLEQSGFRRIGADISCRAVTALAIASAAFAHAKPEQ